MLIIIFLLIILVICLSNKDSPLSNTLEEPFIQKEEQIKEKKEEEDFLPIEEEVKRMLGPKNKIFRHFTSYENEQIKSNREVIICFDTPDNFPYRAKVFPKNEKVYLLVILDVVPDILYGSANPHREIPADINLNDPKIEIRTTVRQPNSLTVFTDKLVTIPKSKSKGKEVPKKQKTSKKQASVSTKKTSPKIASKDQAPKKIVKTKTISKDPGSEPRKSNIEPKTKKKLHEEVITPQNRSNSPQKKTSEKLQPNSDNIFINADGKKELKPNYSIVAKDWINDNLTYLNTILSNHESLIPSDKLPEGREAWDYISKLLIAEGIENESQKQGIILKK